MKVGRFPCFEAFTATTFDMSAYQVGPGRYQVRLTVGDASRTQDFRILVDPRLEGLSADPMAEYAEIDQLSESLYGAVVEMGDGLAELHRLKDQLHVILPLTEAEDVQEGGVALDAAMDAWIEELLQVELKTFQNHYQYEARLLMKLKDLLDEMGGANLPLSQGMRDVTRDYLSIWTDLETRLQVIKGEDVPAFNEVLARAGLPLLYVPTPIS
jgi:hypothetical protein